LAENGKPESHTAALKERLRMHGTLWLYEESIGAPYKPTSYSLIVLSGFPYEKFSGKKLSAGKKLSVWGHEL
jgi:hypothetical protein